MNALLRTLSFAALSSLLAAQQQATTLWHLAARAHVVVVAEAVAATDPSPDWHRVEFAAKVELKGAPGARFSLLEPAGRCCGHALFAVVPGQSYLLFLERRGPVFHPMAGDRGIETETPELLTHVRSLLDAEEPETTGRALALGVAAAHPRIAQDSALALAAVPVLPTDARACDTIREALATTALSPTTALPALATAVARLDPTRSAAELVPYYLAAATDDAARSIAAALASTPAADVARALHDGALDDERALVRAADLAASRPDPAALPLLQTVLVRSKHPRTRLAAAEALLELGADPRTLEGRIERVVLDLAVQRRSERHGLRLVETGAQR